MDCVPIIETERLILTGYHKEDFPEMVRLYQDPIATQYVPPGILSREACWSLWLQYQGLWAEFGFGYWAIKDKATDRIIGETGFADFQRETVPAMPSMLEKGIIIHSDYHGRGYGYEATRAIMEWQQKKFNLPLCCLILPDNLVSLKLAKKCGFSFNDYVMYGNHRLCLGLNKLSHLPTHSA